MKDEIKEILDYVFSLAIGEAYTCEYKDIQKVRDYITNLQESEAYYYGQYKDYKSRNEKAIEYIKEDMYVEPNELYGLVDGEHLLNILQGEDNTQETLYRYTPEKGFRLVGDEDVKR